MPEYDIKDSGVRREFDSGMVRDTDEGKLQWHRVVEGPMSRRWATHLTKGAAKYPDLEDGSANWTLASGTPELTRFKQSAFRHFMQWFFDETDEDHAAAVFFNINGAEYVKERMAEKSRDCGCPEYCKVCGQLMGPGHFYTSYDRDRPVSCAVN